MQLQQISFRHRSRTREALVHSGRPSKLRRPLNCNCPGRKLEHTKATIELPGLPICRLTALDPDREVERTDTEPYSDVDDDSVCNLVVQALIRRTEDEQAVDQREDIRKIGNRQRAQQEDR